MTFRIGVCVLQLLDAPLQHGLLGALWDDRLSRPHDERTIGAVLKAVYGDTSEASERKLESLVRDTNDKLRVHNAQVRTGAASVWLEMPASP